MPTEGPAIRKAQPSQKLSVGICFSQNLSERPRRLLLSLGVPSRLSPGSDPGPSRSHPGSVGVPSRFVMCFVLQRFGPIQIPRWGPSRPVLVPSRSRASFHDRAWTGLSEALSAGGLAVSLSLSPYGATKPRLQRQNDNNCAATPSFLAPLTSRFSKCFHSHIKTIMGGPNFMHPPPNL